LSLRPIRSDRVMFSSQRGVSIALWPPRESDREQLRFTRSSISIQELRIEDGKVTYGESFRFPASERTLLVARILQDFAMEGRHANRNYQVPGDSTPSGEHEQLRKVIAEHFRGQSVIVKTIVSTLLELGYETNPKAVGDILRDLERDGTVSSEERTARAGHTYTVWTFGA
jgi:hypothetical protein